MSAKLKAEQYYIKLKIEDDKIKRKTEELIRLLDLKAQSGLPGRANSCKYAVCLHLACKLHDHPFDRVAALKSCGCDPTVYREAYALFELICKEFECPFLVKFVKKIFNRYKEIFINSLPENRRADVHFDNPSYAAASFLLTAEYKKVKVDKKKLLEITDCRTKDFEQSYESINELIFIPLKMAEAKAAELKAESSKSKTSIENNTGNSEPSKNEVVKSTELNDRKVDDKQRGEDFIRAKVNDILTVKQTEEDIESIKLELMVDIDSNALQYESKKSNQQQDLDDEDWFKRVLEENKAQKLLAQQQASIPKKQCTLDLFVKKSDAKALSSLQEESLIPENLGNLAENSQSNKEKEKQDSSMKSSKTKRSSESDKGTKPKKKSKKS